jgi:hypothetical protein
LPVAMIASQLTNVRILRQERNVTQANQHYGKPAKKVGLRPDLDSGSRKYLQNEFVR